MKTISKYESVLTYLKKYKLYNKSAYEYLILFGVNPNDIIKFMEHPEKCGNWPFDFVCQVESAIAKIDKKYLIDFPKIDLQTEEDRVLSKLLRKNNFFSFFTYIFNSKMVSIQHIIQFMERDPIIFEWNADFVWQVSQEVNQVKNKLL
ncbi:MAG: hypothetical protein ACYC0A_10335 [Lutibacter sp.]